MTTKAKPKRALNYEDFELVHMSYNEKAKKLVIEYREAESTGDGWQHTSHETPHPDLINSLEAFKPHAARVLGLQKGWDFAREAVRNNEEQLKAAIAGVKDADGSIVNISDITLLGEGETAGVKVSGSLKALNGVTKFKLPVIRFNSEAMAIEKTIMGLYEKANEAAYGFIFQGKRKDPDMFDENDADGKPVKKKKQLDLEEEANKANLQSV